MGTSCLEGSNIVIHTYIHIYIYIVCVCVCLVTYVLVGGYRYIDTYIYRGFRVWYAVACHF